MTLKEASKEHQDWLNKNYLRATSEASFRMGATWQQEQYKSERDQAIELIRRYREALEHTKKICLCDRSMLGFDYGENHPKAGKCGIGKRWLAPEHIVNEALEAPLPDWCKI